jgi:hypothetical protein
MEREPSNEPVSLDTTKQRQLALSFGPCNIEGVRAHDPPSVTGRSIPMPCSYSRRAALRALSG